MTDSNKPTPPVYDTEPDPNATSQILTWSIAFAAILFADPTFKRLVATTRKHFGLHDPTDQEDINLNLRAASRERVALYVRDRLTSMAQRPDDHPLFPLLQLAFDLDAAVVLPDPADQEGIQHVRHFEQLTANAIRASQLPDAIAGFFIGYLTDRIIEGDLAVPRPMPTWLASQTLALPFGEDILLFAYLNRMGDVDTVADELRALHHEHFVPGKRNRPPARADRDRWVLATWIVLKDAMECDSRDEDDPLLQLLAEGPGYEEPTLYDLVLMAAIEGPYAADFDEYDLDTADGQMNAKRLLRQIVDRQRVRLGNHVRQAEDNVTGGDLISYP